jgi:type II secretory pathway component GspD/PulD (secretin)
MVLDANDLTYKMQEDSNVFVVTAKEKTAKNLITKVYQLKYATVSSSKLNSTISTSDSGGGASKSSGVASGGLEEVLKDSLSPDGKVVEDPRTNSLIITDLPAQFDIIESTIAKLDVPIPQILIEVEMIDVSKSAADQLGVTYGATPLSFSGSSETVDYPLSLGRKSGVTPGTFSTSGLTAAMQLLMTSTDARTLARPRILTLNNETAQIEISTDQAISLSQSTIGTSGNLNTSTTAPERYNTGVILKVTPQANLLTREVTMAVSPKVIDVIASQVQPNASGAATIYDPETRGSDSVLKLKDGQSMVIGGLMRDQDSKTVTKLPFLGDIPFLGSAFRSVNDTKNERELIIFITPHIIDDSNQTALKGDNSVISAQAALDIQDADDRVQSINSSLNTYEKY